MGLILYHLNFKIEVFDDNEYNSSAERPISYDQVIQAEQDMKYSPSSQHAIKVYEADKLINTAIILASGGGTGVHEDTAFIDQGNLIIRCSNKLFSLSLPELKINWMTEPDLATCFSVHKYQDTYISHGELSISRIDRTGKKLWSYGGADIFVCLYEGNPFEMHDNFIELTDFNGSKYRIDYNGQSISYEPSGYYSQQPVTARIRTNKKWWQFW
jgi:hypothetical protein